MGATVVEILGHDGADRPLLPLTRATRDALAAYVAINAPTGRRKWAEAQWDLTPDEARGVIEASASATTIDKIWKHPNGGWNVLLPVMGAVIGHSIEDHIQANRKRHVEIARRHGALVRDLRTRPAASRARGAELGPDPGERRGSDRR